ncbi:hypothetical protein CPC08DRAFT_769983 [Agrocybe pediades]|nr:hypothetical protein CPC08DRAFT_769983 [Agrocybe pediades]
MSSTSSFPYSVSQQKSTIGSNLNSSLLLQFLFGIYTGLFPATLYIYLRKKNRTRSKDRIVIGSMSALYSATAIFVVASWVFVDVAALAVVIILDVTPYILLLLADGLLTINEVWRCFHACKRSLLMSLLPIALFVGEIGLAVTSIVIRCIFDTNPDFATPRNVLISNHLESATLIITAATSIVSTVSICFQIWRHTTLKSRTWMHYRTIIRALVEFSGIYSVAVVFIAILDLANTAQLKNSLGVFNMEDYVAVVSQMVAGLAPTLMIARLSLSSGKELQVDTEGSFPHLPSDLVDPALHPANSNRNLEGSRADLGVRQNELMWEGQDGDESESEEIRTMPRAE